MDNQNQNCDQQKELAAIIRAIEGARLIIDDATKRLKEICQVQNISQSEAVPLPPVTPSTDTSMSQEADGRVVEGTFNGQNMVGPDGATYPIPPNYASKSKLVEGDRMKLTIQTNGAFVFKQVAPIERERKVGLLIRSPQDQSFQALVGDKAYNVILASVTYFHGDIGDEIIILVPKYGTSKWAAVENIIKRGAVPQSVAMSVAKVGAVNDVEVSSLDNEQGAGNREQGTANVANSVNPASQASQSSTGPTNSVLGTDESLKDILSDFKV